MRGNDTVIAHLNEALREELSAINQYFLHAEMCQNWGFERLYKILYERVLRALPRADAADVRRRRCRRPCSADRQLHRLSRRAPAHGPTWTCRWRRPVVPARTRRGSATRALPRDAVGCPAATAAWT